MSYWITVYCTKSLSPLTTDDLQRGVNGFDFASIAELFGLTEEEGYAAEEAVRFEPVRGGFMLHYRPGGLGSGIGIYRSTGAEARGCGQEALEQTLAGSEPARVREVLSTVEDHIAFALKAEDYAHTSMGFPIAWYTAMWLAEQGAGLVRVGGEEWWDPANYREPLFCQQQVAR
jgi:hypothetical protein